MSQVAAGRQWVRAGWFYNGAEKDVSAYLKGANSAEIQIAVLSFIAERLDRLVGLVECPNVARGFSAMQETARILRRKKRRKVKAPK